MSRKWTVEDNVVALYLARFGKEGLMLNKKEIRDLIQNTGILKKAFLMRVENYRYIVTEGREGLDAGYNEGFSQYKKLYNIFKLLNKKRFKEYVNLILETRLSLRKRIKIKINSK